MKRKAFLGALVAGAAWSIGRAQPAAFPSRPITLILGFAPGGSGEQVIRPLQKELGTSLGDPIVLEHKPGATGAIAASFVARSAPDGYILLVAGIGGHAILPALSSKLSFDPVDDFTPVAAICGGPNVLLVGNSMPIHSVPQLLDFARRHPGKLNYGSTGLGSSLHMSGELLRKMTGIEIQHIPYQGGGPLLNALLGGQIEMAMANLPAALPHIRAGSVRAIAVTTRERFPGAPDIPTFAESGVPGYDVTSWYALFGPKNVPRAVVEKLNREVNAVLMRDDYRLSLQQNGLAPMPGSPQQLSEMLKNDLAKWREVVQSLRLPPIS